MSPLTHRQLPWHPRITIVEPFAPDLQVEGLAVAIDVLRAFSNLAYLFVEKGLKDATIVSDFDVMQRLRGNFSSHLLMGEKEGRVPTDFAAGNSPSRSLNPAFNVVGQSALLSTSAGTVGLLRALEQGANPVLTGSFVNITSTLRYIQQIKPPVITLIACGNSARERAIEDILFAGYLRDLIEGRQPTLSIDEIREQCRSDRFNSRFFDPVQAECYPQADFDLCFQDRMAVVIRAESQTVSGIAVAHLEPLFI